MEKQNLAVTIFIILFIATVGGIGTYGAIKHPIPKTTVANTKPTPEAILTTPQARPVEITPLPTETPSPSPTPSPTPFTGLTIKDDQNGQFVKIKVGDSIQLALSSTYWSLQGGSGTADPTILSLVDSTTQPAAPGTCVPGGGCGTFIATYKALAKGTTKIEATRTTCGEALKCTAAQSKFSVTIIVR